MRRLGREPRQREAISPAKAQPALESLDDFIGKLTQPRAVWIMVPAGDATEKTVTDLAARMEAGDIIIDGGNSYFKDDARRALALREKQINYVDVGTSGGVWGLSAATA